MVCILCALWLANDKKISPSYLEQKDRKVEENLVFKYIFY